ncbi:MAG: YfhO family protein, partial [Ruminococcus sp.]|nr:YfhO family protein [Ruminococcus sp.]
DQQILVTDLWHQYYPFLVDFQDKLQEGSSLLWTWKSGGGTNYLALMAYYLASPLNFLSVFVPAEYLREFLAVITCVKIGLAGFFFSQFLRITYKRRDITVAIFSIMYGLCSYIMGYYWNVIWMDTVALLPLVVAGTIALLKEGKFRLYVISLAVAVFANYYIGLFVCIFVMLISIAYCIVDYIDFKNLMLRFVKMASFSALALAMTAIITIPTAIALGSTHSTDNTFPATFALNIAETDDFAGVMEAFAEVLSNTIAFVEPSTKEGLPNVYSGMIALVLGLLFFTCKDIKIREKIASGFLLVFFILSFIIRQLDFIWHGFHFPNMIPYRFAFLFSFVLITMAYRAFMCIEKTKLIHIIFVIAAMSVIIGIGYDHHDEKKIVMGTIFITVLIIAWLIMYCVKTVPKQTLALALFIICLAEATCTAYIGVKTVTTTTSTSYPLGGADTKRIVNFIDRVEKDNEDLFHTEVTDYHTLNDNALIGINGISIFSSVSNCDVSAYMERFGICGWVGSNRYTYQESSPFTNLFLNMKYLIAPDGVFLDKTHLKLKQQYGSVKLLENQFYIPQGFMVNEDLLDFKISTASANPFDNQNEMFRKATGLNGNIYEQMEVVSQGHTDYTIFPVNKKSYGNYSYELLDTEHEAHVKLNYTPDRDGTAYAYFDCDDAENVDIKINDNTVVTNYVKRPYIMQMGDVKKGDKLSLYADLSEVTTGNLTSYCMMFNEELFREGYEKLAQSSMKCTKSTDTLIEGSIDVKEDGVFFTSISYDKGWKAYVDGEEVEITPLCDAQVAFKLSKGHHDIKLKYCPKGFPLGVTLTVLSIAVLVALSLFINRKDLFKNFKKEKVTEKESE